MHTTQKVVFDSRFHLNVVSGFFSFEVDDDEGFIRTTFCLTNFVNNSRSFRDHYKVYTFVV